MTSNISWVEQLRCGACEAPIYVICVLGKEGSMFHFYTAEDLEIHDCPICNTPLDYSELAP